MRKIEVSVGEWIRAEDVTYLFAEFGSERKRNEFEDLINSLIERKVLDERTYVAHPEENQGPRSRLLVSLPGHGTPALDTIRREVEESLRRRLVMSRLGPASCIQCSIWETDARRSE
jgi:hypothetical protein